MGRERRRKEGGGNVRMRKLFTLLGVTLAVSLFNVTTYAAEAKEGEKAVTEEELVPAKEPLVVKYTPIAPSPAKVSVKALADVFKDAGLLSVPLQEQNKAFPNGGGSIKSISIRAFHDGAISISCSNGLTPRRIPLC